MTYPTYESKHAQDADTIGGRVSLEVHQASFFFSRALDFYAKGEDFWGDISARRAIECNQRAQNLLKYGNAWGNMSYE